MSAAREVRRHDVAGEDGVVRTRAERGRARPLMTKFGQVSVSRIAYRSPDGPNVHLLDGALNLPEEKHSHGLRKLTAVEAARGSMEDAQAAVTRASEVRIGKRQLEDMARRAAEHAEAFYAWRLVSPVPEGWPLILTFDGKGIVMLPEALRPATAKAAAPAGGKLASVSPVTANRRTSPITAAASHDARDSSRCVLSGVRSRTCSAIVHPFRLGSSLITARKYFLACKNGSIRPKHGRKRSSRSACLRRPTRAPMLAAASDFVVVTNT